MTDNNRTRCTSHLIRGQNVDLFVGNTVALVGGHKKFPILEFLLVICAGQFSAVKCTIIECDNNNTPESNYVIMYSYKRQPKKSLKIFLPGRAKSQPLIWTTAA